ncbi:pyridoxamine 5'-phosphate oxidase family protein [Actinomadura sp. 6N118]|uniref:pyridoxamine 5'-phosphate oxidase family protein n=1 Tax=Actinomadura sp. 6N118 TaxID=3375151 RepID=UPI0037A18415
MNIAMPTAELLFSEKDATPISSDDTTIKSWKEALECLESAPKAWLSTARPDGRPHAMPLLVVLVDGVPSFASRPGSRKSTNLAASPSCVITVSGQTLDLVIEGDATRVHDEAGLRRIADAFKAKISWEFALRDGRAHQDDLPGSPEYAFYRLTPRRAFGYGSDGLTATRWRFDHLTL